MSGASKVTISVVKHRARTVLNINYLYRIVLVFGNRINQSITFFWFVTTGVKMFPDMLFDFSCFDSKIAVVHFFAMVNCFQNIFFRTNFTTDELLQLSMQQDVLSNILNLQSVIWLMKYVSVSNVRAQNHPSTETVLKLPLVMGCLTLWIQCPFLGGALISFDG